MPYEQQAFRYGKAYGVQFHLEVDVALATEWGEVPAYAQSLRGLLGDNGLPTLLAAIGRYERESVALARRLFAAWLEHVVGLGRGSALRPSLYDEGEPTKIPFDVPWCSFRGQLSGGGRLRYDGGFDGPDDVSAGLL